MLRLSDLIINSSDSLRSALQRMTRNRRGVLFVCDEDSHLVGVLSDGDVRRSLLDDALMVSPIRNLMNTDPITASTLEEAENLLTTLAIVAVPVVDDQGIIREAAVENQSSVLALTDDDETVPPARTAVVAIIPARGGSKRIPKKNLAVVAGRSLLGWAVHTARAASHVSYVIVSTDSEEIADAARKAGAEVPWLRPPELAQDDTGTIDVLIHALDWSVATLKPAPEIGVLLEPTAPFRRPDHVEDAVDLLMKHPETDCVMSVSEVPHVLNPEELLTVEDGVVRPYLPYREMANRNLRGRQSSVFVPNGLVYAFRIASVLNSRSLYGTQVRALVTPWSEFLDVDTYDDLEMASLRLERAQRQ